MGDHRLVLKSKTFIATGSVGALVAVAGLAGAVQAQEPPEPTAQAVAECDGEVGLIVVDIFDDSSETYDVYIDDELVDSEVTDTDEGTEPLVYETPEDGVYLVDVYWIEGETDILNAEVEVDCVADEPTPPTTVPVVPVDPGPVTQPVAAEPTYTG
jgi:hypothetical protein